MLRRRRFADLVQRQLDLFEEENRSELEEVAAARDRWRRASRDEAEEAFGEEADRVDWAAEALAAICDHYALALDEATERAYRQEFARGVRKRLSRLYQAFVDQTDIGDH